MIQSMMDEVFMIADRVFRVQTGAACPEQVMYTFSTESRIAGLIASLSPREH